MRRSLSRILKSGELVFEMLNLKFSRVNESKIKNEDSNIKRINIDNYKENDNGLEAILLKNVEKRAAVIEEKALQKAAEIIKTAEIDAENIKEEMTRNGYNEGYEYGLNQARKEMHDEYKNGLKAIAEIIEELSENKKDILKQVEKDIVNLGIKIAEKILISEIDKNESSFINIVKNALNKADLKTMNKVLLRVSAKEYELVNNAKDELLLDMDNVLEIEVVKDGRFKSGDCVVEYASGKVEAGIDRQFKILSEEFGKLTELEKGENR